MGSFAGSSVEEHSKRYGKSVMESPSIDLKSKQRDYDIDKLFQSLAVKPSMKLMSSSFHNLKMSENTSSTSKFTSPRTPRIDSVSLKQALRDHCLSKASEMAAQKRLSAASPRVFSELDRIKSSRSVPLSELSQSGSCLSSYSGDYEIKIDEIVTSPSYVFVEDNVIEIDKYVTSPPSHSDKKGKLDNSLSSRIEKSKSVDKVTRLISCPKKKILLKKLKIRVVSTEKDEETVSSLDSNVDQLLCQRCQCSLRNHPAAG